MHEVANEHGGLRSSSASENEFCALGSQRITRSKLLVGTISATSCACLVVNGLRAMKSLSRT